MGIVSGGGGGSAALAPPVTLTGTNPATVPLSIVGAAAQGNGVGIFRVRSNDNTNGLLVAGDGANSIGAVQLNGPNFGGLNLTPNGTSLLAADTDVVHASGSATGGFILSAFNAAPADASLGAGDLAIWFDKTNAAAKLMVKAKQANGTVVTAAIALA